MALFYTPIKSSGNLWKLFLISEYIIREVKFMYAKIIDIKSKLCSVGIGNDVEFYKSIGMENMDVEQAYDRNWYIKGYAPQRPLEELKTQKILNLKANRDEAEVEPITYQGYSFDYDSKARERINAAIIALESAGSSGTLTWTTADNQDVKATSADLRGVIAQVALRSDKLHIAYREAKEKVEAATTVAEVEAVTLEV